MPGLHWNPEIRLGDLVTLAGFIFTIVSVTFAALELRRNRKVDGERFLFDVTERYFRDPEVRKFFYRLDYNDWTFDQERFALSDEERWLDALLYDLDLMGHLYDAGLLSKEKAQMIRFQASRVIRNPEVQKYLAWLDGQYHGAGVSGGSHAKARLLARL
jgi:hypothetical protein